MSLRGDCRCSGAGARLRGPDEPEPSQSSLPGEPEPRRPWRPDVVGAAVLVALLVGVALRLTLYLQLDSLWRDEAKLMSALESVPHSGLVERLPFGQACPPGLALLLKGLLEAGLGSVAWLRLPSLLAGIASLALLPALLARIRPRIGLGVASLTALWAAQSGLVLFSSQAKPYAIDAAVAAALLLLAWPHLAPSEGDEHPRSPGPFLGACAIAPLLSYPAIFGVASVLLADLGVAPRRRWRRVVATGALAAAGVAVTYPLGDPPGEYLTLVWERHFAEASLGWWRHALATWAVGGATAEHVVRASTALRLVGWLELGLAALGVAHLAARRRFPLLGALLGPFVLCIAASALGRYPVTGRLLLFALPSLTGLAGFGLAALLPRPLLFRSVTVYLGAVSAFFAVGTLLDATRSYPGVREGLERIHQRAEPGDVVLVDLYASQVVEHYRRLHERGRFATFPEAELFFEHTDETDFHRRRRTSTVVERLPADAKVWLLAEPIGYHREPVARGAGGVPDLRRSLRRSRRLLSKEVAPRLILLRYSEARAPGETGAEGPAGSGATRPPLGAMRAAATRLTPSGSRTRPSR